LEQETISHFLLDGYEFKLLKKLYFCVIYISYELTLGVLMFQGKKNPGTDLQTVKGFLGQLKEAKVMKVDRLVI